MNSILDFKDIPNENVRICCCCLSTANLSDMHEKWKDETKSYFDVVNICYYKVINESKPIICHLICKNCIARLIDAYNFKLQIVKAQETLLDYFRGEVDVAKLERKIKHKPSIHIENVKIEDDCFDAHDYEPTSDLSMEPEYDKIGANKTSGKTRTSVRLRKAKPNENIIFKDEPKDDNSIAAHKIVRQKSPSKKVCSTGAKLKKSVRKSKQNGIAKSSRDPKERTFMKDRDAKIYSTLDYAKMQCTICSKKFQNAHVLAQHANEHFVNYTCEVCGKGFAIRRRYVHHVKRHSTGLYPCGHCARTFDRSDRLHNHVGNQHKCKYACASCDERFRSYYKRQKHMRDAHGDAARFPCDLCAVACLTSTALNAHVRQSHGPRQRAFFCALCAKEFYTSNALKRHTIVHTGERIHECHECGKAYARTNTLVQHLKIHKNIKDYVCSHCGQGFVQKCSLKWHMRKHLQKENTDSADSTTLVIGA